MVTLNALDEESTLNLAYATFNSEQVTGHIHTQKEIAISSYKQGFEDAYSRMQYLATIYESQNDGIYIDLISKAISTLKRSRRFSDPLQKHYLLGESWGIILGFIEFFCTNPLIAEKLVTFTPIRGKIVDQVIIILTNYRSELNEFGLTPATLKTSLKVISNRIKTIKNAINFKDKITRGLMENFLERLANIFS